MLFYIIFWALLLSPLAIVIAGLWLDHKQGHR